MSSFPFPRFLRRSLAVLVVLLAAAVVLPFPASAAQDVAYVRLAHLSPDTPTVDVYVGSVADPAESFVLSGVGYGAVSDYRPLAAGVYVVSMRAAGADANSPPVISTTVDARPAQAYTVAGTGLSAELGLSVLQDRLELPAPGTADVRVINAAVTLPVVDCGPAGEAPWARGVRFGTATDYAGVPLGTWQLAVTSAGREAATLPVELKSNSVYTVLLVERDGEVAAELYRDSAGSAEVPVGAVATGGTSPGRRIDPVMALAGLLLTAVVGGLLGCAGSRTPTGRHARVRGAVRVGGA